MTPRSLPQTRQAESIVLRKRREKKEVSFIEIKVVHEMNNIRIMASAVALAELSSLHGQFFSMFYHHHLGSFIEELVLRITSGKICFESIESSPQVS